MFSVKTNIYYNQTKGPTLMELFTATGKLKRCCLTTIDVRPNLIININNIQGVP